MQEKCDYIIVAMHSGEGNPDIYNQENQGGYFATHTTGVDMLLTGHNHQRNAVTLQNKNGENVLVMNGGGSTSVRPSSPSRRAPTARSPLPQPSPPCIL